MTTAATVSSPALSSLSEYRRPHPHQCRAFFDGHLEVPAHAYGERLHRDAGDVFLYYSVSQLPKLSEIGPGVFGVPGIGRHGHEAQDPHVLELRRFSDQAGGISDAYPCFCGFAGYAHLDQNVLDLARLRRLLGASPSEGSPRIISRGFSIRARPTSSTFCRPP